MPKSLEHTSQAHEFLLSEPVPDSIQETLSEYISLHNNCCHSYSKPPRHLDQSWLASSLAKITKTPVALLWMTAAGGNPQDCLELGIR